MRNTYVKSKENIRKPLLLYEALTDHTYEKYIVQSITKLQRRKSQHLLSMNNLFVKYKVSIITF